MQNIEVLISAMYQEDNSIFDRTNIKTDALLINQCNMDSINREVKKDCIHKMISTTQRGLSKSRNMALDNATGDICLICDDDEVLVDNYKEIILDAFEKNPKYDVLCFKFILKGKKFPSHAYKINFLNALRITSWQIAFKRNSILNKRIKFDENYGSGTPVGSGEENIFLYDCLKNNLKIKYIPIIIGSVAQEESHWFKGFDEEYFINRGKIIKRLMGHSIGMMYCIYFIVFKVNQYKETISMKDAWKNIMKGYKANE